MDTDRPDLRPLGIGEMVDGAIRLYRTQFATLIKISAAVLGPIAVIQIVGTIIIGPIDLTSMLVVDPDATPSEVFEPLIPIYTLGVLTWLLVLLGSVLVQAASITALAQVYQGVVPDWAASLRSGSRRFFALMVSIILIGLGVGFGLIFCLVPGIFLFFVWAVSPAALVAERLGPVAALERSYWLIKGRFWPVVGAIVLGYLLYAIVSQIIGLVTTVLSFAGSDGAQISLLPSVIGSSIVSILAAPFLAAMVTIIYFDLRVRKEGYDLELMAADLERMSGPPTTPPTTSDDDPFGLGRPGT